MYTQLGNTVLDLLKFLLVIFILLGSFSLYFVWQFYFCFLGDDWHLRKTNWCGEEAEILEDEVRRTSPRSLTGWLLCKLVM